MPEQTGSQQLRRGLQHQQYSSCGTVRPKPGRTQPISVLLPQRPHRRSNEKDRNQRRFSLPPVSHRPQRGRRLHPSLHQGTHHRSHHKPQRRNQGPFRRQPFFPEFREQAEHERRVLLGSAAEGGVGLREFHQLRAERTSVWIQSVVVNTEFTLFTIILRVVFFVISLVVTFFYVKTQRQIPKDKMSIQQTAIFLLSAITLTFNDQFYFISVIYPNPTASFISSFFIWNFVFFLFLIWGLFLSRILYEEQLVTDTNQITILKVVLVIIFYVSGLTYSAGYAVYQTVDHPILTLADLQSIPVIVLEAIASTAFVLASIFIIYLYVQIFRTKPNRLWRSSLFMYVSLIFFLSTIVFFFTGGYNIFDYSAPKIMFYVTFMNFYSYFMQYLYSPTSQQLKSFEKDKEKPLKDISIDEHQIQAVDINIQIVEQRLKTEKKSMIIELEYNKQQSRDQMIKQNRSFYLQQQLP